MSWLYWVVPAVLLIALVGLYLWGRSLPRTRQQEHDVLIHAPVEEVWAVATDYLGQVHWRSDLHSVEMAAGGPGNANWKERPQRGRPSSWRVVRVKPQRVLEIAFDDGGQYSGLWSLQFEPAARATRVHLAETLTVPSPFIRLKARAGIPLGATAQGYQQDLKQYVEANATARARR